MMSTKNDGVEGSRREKGLLAHRTVAKTGMKLSKLNYFLIAFLIICTVQPRRATFEKWATHHHQFYHPEL